MRILVRAPNWIGDQILAYPFFHALREKYPSAKITSLCVPWVSSIQFRKRVDEVVVFDPPRNASVALRFFELDQAARSLARGGVWDLGFTLPNSFSSAWMLYRAKAKKRRGYSFEGRGFLLNSSIPWNDGDKLHRSLAYLKLVEDAKIPASPEEFWRGKVFEDEKEWVTPSRISPPTEPYYILAPGATADSRRWSEESFLELSKKIHQKTKQIGLIIGGKKEKELASSLIARAPGQLFDFTDQGELPSLSQLFKNASFMVGNESGLSHFSSLLGCPTFIVCGAADPKRTTPIGPGKVFVETNPIECWPCEKNVCKFTDHRKNACLNGISPEKVFSRMEMGGVLG